MSRIITVSNRLPVHVTEENGRFVLARSIGGLATALGAVMRKYPMHWIGWPGIGKRLSKRQLAQLQFPDTLVPVMIPKGLFRRYYDRVSNGHLWPLLHGILPRRLCTLADWAAFYEVAKRFGDVIHRHIMPKDVLWLHDYHLALLPEVLRGEGLRNRIGFFLHTPFPPAHILCKWQHYRHILESLVKVDVLGFQTERDVSNFHECLAASGLSMRRSTIVQAFPIGIDYDAYRTTSTTPAVHTLLRQLQKVTIGKKVILSVSRLDYTKGIIEQLLAVEKALETYGPARVLYKLVVAPSRETVIEYQKLRQEIEQIVAAINKRFKVTHGVEPVEFTYRSHGFEELSAWYRVADILLITPKIDGMNLVAKEYVAARDNECGAVVLSKTIGAAFQLRNAILVDPLDVDAIAAGLMHALTMPVLERERRWRALRLNVRREDVFWWARKFLDALHQNAPTPLQVPDLMAAI